MDRIQSAIVVQSNTNFKIQIAEKIILSSTDKLNIDFYLLDISLEYDLSN